MEYVMTVAVKAFETVAVLAAILLGGKAFAVGLGAFGGLAIAELYGLHGSIYCLVEIQNSKVHLGVRGRRRKHYR